MPNQRAKNKKVVGTWVPDSVVEELDKIAKELNIPRSKVVEMIIENEIKNRKGQK